MIDADCRLILPEPPPSPQTQQAGAQEHDASGQGHGSKINLLHPEVQIFTITIISPDAEKRVFSKTWIARGKQLPPLALAFVVPNRGLRAIVAYSQPTVGMYIKP